MHDQAAEPPAPQLRRFVHLRVPDKPIWVTVHEDGVLKMSGSGEFVVVMRAMDGVQLQAGRTPR